MISLKRKQEGDILSLGRANKCVGVSQERIAVVLKSLNLCQTTAAVSTPLLLSDHQQQPDHRTWISTGLKGSDERI